MLEDTADAVGPYIVETATVGTRSSDRLELRHTRDDGFEAIVVMANVGDDGDGTGDLYRGEISGQDPGTEIGYYVLLVRGDEVVDRDPAGDITDGPRFVFTVAP